MIRLIDVSEWNGYLADPSHPQIDWATAQQSGLFQGAIVRLGYGTHYVDHDVAYNVTTCRKLGIPLAFYLYAVPSGDPAASAQAHAATVTNILNPLGGIRAHDMAVVLDLEVVVPGWTPDDYHTFWTTWRSAMQAAVTPDFPFWLYSYLNFAQTHLLADPPQWIAKYSSTPPSIPYLGWQYTDQFSVPGIPTAVDASWFDPSVIQRCAPAAPPVQWSVGSSAVGWSFPAPTEANYQGWAQSVDQPATQPQFHSTSGYYKLSWMPSGTHQVVLTFFYAGYPPQVVRSPSVTVGPPVPAPTTTVNTQALIQALDATQQAQATAIQALAQAQTALNTAITTLQQAQADQGGTR